MPLSKEEKNRHITQPILGYDGVYTIVDPELYSFDALQPEIDAMADAEPELTSEEALEKILEDKATIWYSTTEAAEYLGYAGRQVIASLCDAEQLVYKRADLSMNSAYLISEAALDEYRARVVKTRRKYSVLAGPMTDETTGYVSVKQAADYLDKAIYTIHRIVFDDKLEHVKLSTGKLMLSAEAVQDYKLYTKDAIYRPSGFRYIFPVSKDQMKKLPLIARLELKTVVITASIPNDKLHLLRDLARLPFKSLKIKATMNDNAVEELQRLGLEPELANKPSKPTPKRSPLDLPERYQQLLEQAQRDDPTKQ